MHRVGDKGHKLHENYFSSLGELQIRAARTDSLLEHTCLKVWVTINSIDSSVVHIVTRLPPEYKRACEGLDIFLRGLGVSLLERQACPAPWRIKWPCLAKYA